MKWLTFKIQKQAGFRFNLIDSLLILATFILSLSLYKYTPKITLYLIPLYLVFSFFLFCNVFRIRNKLEVTWYIPFTLLSISAVYQFDFSFFWYGVVFILEPVKWSLIIYTIKSGSYVGAFYKRLY